MILKQFSTVVEVTFVLSSGFSISIRFWFSNLLINNYHLKAIIQKLNKKYIDQAY